MANRDSAFRLPDEELTDKLLERVQFSVSSRNAQATVCDSVAYVFGASMPDSPRQIVWKYVTTGVVAMLRHKEIVKKRYTWSLNLCIHHIKHGVLVWNGRIPLNCNYTVVVNNFHVLALGEGEGILGIMFQDEKAAANFHKVIQEWIEDAHKDEKGVKVPPQPPRVKFRKEMISKPCDFQHVQGSEALDQCVEIEAVKAQIIKSLMALRRRSRADIDGVHRSRPKKKDARKYTVPFKEVGVPAAVIGKGENGLNSVDGPHSSGDSSREHHSGDSSRERNHTGWAENGDPRSEDYYSEEASSSLVQSTSFDGSEGSDSSLCDDQLGRLSPLNLEEELASFGLTYTYPSHC